MLVTWLVGTRCSIADRAQPVFFYSTVSNFIQDYVMFSYTTGLQTVKQDTSATILLSYCSTVNTLILVAHWADHWMSCCTYRWVYVPNYSWFTSRGELGSGVGQLASWPFLWSQPNPFSIPFCTHLHYTCAVPWWSQDLITGHRFLGCGVWCTNALSNCNLIRLLCGHVISLAKTIFWGSGNVWW